MGATNYILKEYGFKKLIDMEVDKAILSDQISELIDELYEDNVPFEDLRIQVNQAYTGKKGYINMGDYLEQLVRTSSFYDDMGDYISILLYNRYNSLLVFGHMVDEVSTKLSRENPIVDEYKPISFLPTDGYEVDMDELRTFFNELEKENEYTDDTIEMFLSSYGYMGRGLEQLFVYDSKEDCCHRIFDFRVAGDDSIAGVRYCGGTKNEFIATYHKELKNSLKNRLTNGLTSDNIVSVGTQQYNIKINGGISMTNLSYVNQAGKMLVENGNNEHYSIDSNGLMVREYNIFHNISNPILEPIRELAIGDIIFYNGLVMYVADENKNSYDLVDPITRESKSVQKISATDVSTPKFMIYRNPIEQILMTDTNTTVVELLANNTLNTDKLALNLQMVQGNILKTIADNLQALGMKKED